MTESFDTYILLRAIEIAVGQGGVVRPVDVERKLAEGQSKEWGISRYAVRKAFKGFSLDGILRYEGSQYRYNPGNNLYITMRDAMIKARREAAENA